MATSLSWTWILILTGIGYGSFLAFTCVGLIAYNKWNQRRLSEARRAQEDACFRRMYEGPAHGSSRSSFDSEKPGDDETLDARWRRGSTLTTTTTTTTPSTGSMSCYYASTCDAAAGATAPDGRIRASSRYTDSLSSTRDERMSARTRAAMPLDEEDLQPVPAHRGSCHYSAGLQPPAAALPHEGRESRRCGRSLMSAASSRDSWEL